jgi:flagellar protein FlgJ
MELTTTSLASTLAQQDPDAVQRAKVDKAAVQFEGLFIHQMLKEMRKSAQQIAGDNGLFKDQSGSGLLDLADTMLADSTASQRAFGIADTIVRQMLPASSAAFKSTGLAVALPRDGIASPTIPEPEDTQP